MNSFPPSQIKKNQILEIENNVRSPQCPCCSSQNLSLIGNIEYAKNTRYSSTRVYLRHVPQLWSCNNCRSGFTQNIISEQDSIHLYSSGDSWSSELFQEAKTNKMVEAIDELILPNSLLLDVGCSNGAFLDYAKQKGAFTFGLEYSHKNIETLKEKGHRPYSEWNTLNNQHFDLITAFDVVEHLYSLNLFLEECHQHLANEGKLLLVTGNIQSWSAIQAKNRWWYVRHPEHIIFPSLDYFRTLKNFELLTSTPVYPMKFNPRNKSNLDSGLKLLKSITKNILRGSFHPLPFIPCDHFILIMQKK